MPLNTTLVGQSTAPFVQEVDARWTMAYSAGLGDTDPCYLDTLQADQIVAHPLFPVCLEWPIILALRDIAGNHGLTEAERQRGVHATHDLHIHRLIKSGDHLTTQGTMVGIEKRKPGPYQTIRLETTDQQGRPVCTTWQGNLNLAVEMIGPDQPATEAPSVPRPKTTGQAPKTEFTLPIAANAAHIYTECARIWNPIHTDPQIAQQAGLPGIILHGTATLALAVSRIIAEEAGGEPSRVKRICGRFGAMVLMPSTIRLHVLAREKMPAGDGIFFTVYNSAGKPAIRDGFILLRNQN